MKKVVFSVILLVSLIGNVVFAIDPQLYIEAIMGHLDPNVEYTDHPIEASNLRENTNCLGYALGYDLYVWPWSVDYPDETEVVLTLKSNYGYNYTSSNDGEIGAYGNNGTIGHFVRIEYDDSKGYNLGDLKNRYCPDGPVFEADHLDPFITYGPLKLKFK